VVTTSIRIIGKDIVDAKLLLAAPRILAGNRLMVGTMLDFVKAVTVAATPLGPGHFGYHLRDSFTTDVKSGPVKTTGVLKSPPTGYWREFGTGGRFRGPKKSALRSYVAAIGGAGTGGERRFYTAHHALAGIHKFIAFYYGKAQWWRL
jgi:hypothetical protein